MLFETKIDQKQIYFHGSSEARVTQLEAPSYEHPFYVTPDLHYAMAFCTKDSSSTGEYSFKKEFTPFSQNFVYVVTLKPDCKVFDFRDHENAEFQKIYKIIDKDLVDWIKIANQDNELGAFDLKDVYEFTAALELEVIKPVDESNANYLEYGKLYAKSKHQMSPKLFLKACSFVKKNGLYGASKNYDIHQIMVPILKGLHKLGFYGVLTAEHDSNEEIDGSPAKVTTEYAIGVFDVKGLDILSLVPMKYKWLQKINPSYLSNSTDVTAEQKIRRFIQLYKSIAAKQKLQESFDMLLLKNDIPEDEFKKMISTAKVSNKYFDIVQFQKLYDQDYVWSVLLDNGRCVAAAALLKNFGPEKNMTYVNELQSLVSGKDYGKKMLLALQDSYDKLWLMADASVKSDVLLRFYRNPTFNFTEHILPAEESKYEVDTRVFAPKGISDEEKWHKFLKQYFGNEEAVASLNESYGKEHLNDMFNDIIQQYLDKFGIDLSYMKFKVDSQPVYTNGEPCYEYDEDECAGDWTSLGWIRLNPDMQSVMDRYGVAWHGTDDIEEFTKFIIAHELAHEVWNNIADDQFKNDVIEKANDENFSTVYLETVNTNKLAEETFCEYLAHEIVRQRKKIDFPEEEIRDLSRRKHIVTHRVSDDALLFNVGDIVDAPWQIPYKITKKNVVNDIYDSPYVDQLSQEQLEYLEQFDNIAILDLIAQYEPPYSLEQIKAKYPEHIYIKLASDPVHRWRAETGTELIHKEPDEEELDRIWNNWQLMPDYMKKISDLKSVQLFGCTNAEHYKQLKQKSLNESKSDYLKKHFNEPDVDDVVDKFWQIRHRVNAPQNDISWWMKKPYSELKHFVLGFDMRNKRQRRDIDYRKQMVDNDARLLGDKDGYEIWYVPTYEAMRTIGRFYKGVSTEWCVSSDDPSFWFDIHDMSEFIVLVREHMQHDEFDKIAIEMQNGGHAFDVDEFLMWDVENEDDRFCNDDLMHYAWELFIDNGERRKGL